MKPQARAAPFGVLADGRPVRQFTLDSGAGLALQVLDYGAIVRRWLAPGRDGAAADIVLGYDTLAAYEDDTSYMGALVGRYANRIAGGNLTVAGRHWQLARNEGRHHLHGGSGGFHKRLWRARHGADAHCAWLALSRTSPHGEEGYPGTLEVEVRYEVRAGEVRFACVARADRATVVSISQHSYFNLAAQGDILDHELTLAAPAFLPVDRELLPCGEVAPVDGTPFDLRHGRRIGAGLAMAHPQLQLARGYDHNFVLARQDGPCARLRHCGSGRCMELYADTPGLQFYSGNYLDGSLHGKGRRFERHAALCLEPQHFPDAPNQAHFPCALYGPGQDYRTAWRYVFSCPP